MEELETLTNLKTKDIKTIKQMLLEKQGYRCAICGKELTLENSVLDHQHKQRKSDKNEKFGTQRADFKVLELHRTE